LKQNKINKEMPYYLYIHNIYLYQYHDTKPNPINIDWLLGLTPTETTMLLGKVEKLIQYSFELIIRLKVSQSFKFINQSQQIIMR